MTGTQWFILSAEYGLLNPQKTVAPYDKTLNRMPLTERREWAQRVITQMDKELLHVEKIVLLAGMRHREFLPPLS